MVVYSETYGISYDSPEEEEELKRKAIIDWRNSETAKRKIAGLLRFTSYVVQCDETQEQEEFRQWQDSLNWHFQKEFHVIIVGSVNLKPVFATLRFARTDGSIVLFCSASEGRQGAYVLNLWLKEHCNPLDTANESAKCFSSEFERCSAFLEERKGMCSCELLNRKRAVKCKQSCEERN